MTATARKLATVVARIERDTAERNRLIVQMSGEGASYRSIAAVAGVSHVTVATIWRSTSRANGHSFAVS